MCTCIYIYIYVHTCNSYGLSMENGRASAALAVTLSPARSPCSLSPKVYAEVGRYYYIIVCYIIVCYGYIMSYHIIL